MDSQRSEENIDAIIKRLRRRSFFSVTDFFRTCDDAESVLRQEERRKATEERAKQAWAYQPPKTVPVTWVDMCVWLFNKLGIRSRK